MAWKMALWARLGDGDRANKIFKGYLNEQSCSQMFALCGKSLQVDGSLGMTAAIMEMLVQSQDGAVDLLRALPGEWSSGELSGVRVRGAFELDLRWAERQADTLKVSSLAGLPFRLKTVRPVRLTTNGNTFRTIEPVDGVIEFPTMKDRSYVLKLR